MRAVFDTNIVVSAQVFGKRLGWLRSAWASGGLVPLLSKETAAELMAVLAKAKFHLTGLEQAKLLARYLPFAETVLLPSFLPALPIRCRDEADEKFIHLALAGNAGLLVTGDDDLLALRGGAPVPIITLSELRRLAEASGRIPN